MRPNSECISDVCANKCRPPESRSLIEFYIPAGTQDDGPSSVGNLTHNRGESIKRH